MKKPLKNKDAKINKLSIRNSTKYADLYKKIGSHNKMKGGLNETIVSNINSLLTKNADKVNKLKYHLLDKLCDHVTETQDVNKYLPGLQKLKQINETFSVNSGLYKYNIKEFQHDDAEINRLVYALKLIRALYLGLTNKKDEKLKEADTTHPFKKEYITTELLEKIDKETFKIEYDRIKKIRNPKLKVLEKKSPDDAREKLLKAVLQLSGQMLLPKSVVPSVVNEVVPPVVNEDVKKPIEKGRLAKLWSYMKGEKIENSLEYRIKRYNAILNKIKIKPDKCLQKTTIKNNAITYKTGNVKLETNLYNKMTGLNGSGYLTSIENTELQLLSKLMIPTTKNRNEIKINEWITKNLILTKASKHFSLTYQNIECDKTNKDLEEKEKLVNYIELFEGSLEELLEIELKKDPINTITIVSIVYQALICIATYHERVGYFINTIGLWNFLYQKNNENGYYHYKYNNTEFYMNSGPYNIIITNFSESSRIDNNSIDIKKDKPTKKKEYSDLISKFYISIDRIRTSDPDISKNESKYKILDDILNVLNVLYSNINSDIFEYIIENFSSTYPIITKDKPDRKDVLKVLNDKPFIISKVDVNEKYLTLYNDNSLEERLIRYHYIRREFIFKSISKLHVDDKYYPINIAVLNNDENTVRNYLIQIMITDKLIITKKSKHFAIQYNTHRGLLNIRDQINEPIKIYTEKCDNNLDDLLSRKDVQKDDALIINLLYQTFICIATYHNMVGHFYTSIKLDTFLAQTNDYNGYYIYMYESTTFYIKSCEYNIIINNIKTSKLITTQNLKGNSLYKNYIDIVDLFIAKLEVTNSRIKASNITKRLTNIKNFINEDPNNIFDFKTIIIDKVFMKYLNTFDIFMQDNKGNLKILNSKSSFIIKENDELIPKNKNVKLVLISNIKSALLTNKENGEYTQVTNSSKPLMEDINNIIKFFEEKCNNITIEYNVYMHVKSLKFKDLETTTPVQPPLLIIEDNKKNKELLQAINVVILKYATLGNLFNETKYDVDISKQDLIALIKKNIPKLEEILENLTIAIDNLKEEATKRLVLNFEYNNYSSRITTVLQMIINNKQLCDDIIHFANNKNKESENPDIQLIIKLCNIIKYYKSRKYETDEPKIPSYNDYILPLREHLVVNNPDKFLHLMSSINVDEFFNFLIEKMGTVGIDHKYNCKRWKYKMENGNATIQPNELKCGCITLNTTYTKINFQKLINDNQYIFDNEDCENIVFNIAASISTTIVTNPEITLLTKSEKDKITQATPYILKGIIYGYGFHFKYYKYIDPNTWIELDDRDWRLSSRAEDGISTTNITNPPQGKNGKIVNKLPLPADGKGILYYYQKKPLDDRLAALKAKAPGPTAVAAAPGPTAVAAGPTAVAAAPGPTAVAAAKAPGPTAVAAAKAPGPTAVAAAPGPTAVAAAPGQPSPPPQPQPEAAKTAAAARANAAKTPAKTPTLAALIATVLPAARAAAVAAPGPAAALAVDAVVGKSAKASVPPAAPPAAPAPPAPPPAPPPVPALAVDAALQPTDDDLKVFNFEYHNNSCWINTIMQMIIDNKELCAEITKYVDTLKQTTNPLSDNEELMSDLNKIIHLYETEKYETAKPKKPSYNEFILPFRKSLVKCGVYNDDTSSAENSLRRDGVIEDMFEFLIMKIYEIINFINYNYKITVFDSVNNILVKKKVEENNLNLLPDKYCIQLSPPETRNNTTELTFQELIKINSTNKSIWFNTNNCNNLVFKTATITNLKISTEIILETVDGTAENKTTYEAITKTKSKYTLKGFTHNTGGHFIYYKYIQSKNVWIKLDDKDGYTTGVYAIYRDNMINNLNYPNYIPKQDEYDYVGLPPLGMNGEIVTNDMNAIDTNGSNLFYYQIEKVPASGGRKPTKYKSTGQVVYILYKKRKYKRTIYVKDKRKTKYCKINNEYILLSKLKIIE